MLADFPLFGRVGNKFKVATVFWWNRLALRFNDEHRLRLNFFLFLLVFLFFWLLLLPDDLLALPSPILNENLLNDSLVGIDSLEVQEVKIFDAINGGSDASSSQHNIFIVAITHHEVQHIVKFACVVGIADHFNFQFLVWLQNCVFDHRFEN